MKNWKWLPLLGLLALTFCSTPKDLAQPKPAEKSETGNQKSAIVEGLLAKMTLDEKIGQLSLFTTDWGATGPTIRPGYADDVRQGRCGALFNAHSVAFVRELQRVAVEESRLKIPLLFGYDVIHGFKTIFPIPLGEAASFDLEAIEKAASVAAAESAASGLNWTFAPMCDISREPRWGRVMEGAGEDTWLGCRIAEARVRGFQGNSYEKGDKIMACVKHFAAYGAPLAGRDYATVDMSERVFREVYLPPYRAAVEAGAATVMTSFNELDGVPATGNSHLLTEILRDEWHFPGFVVTDYTSINEMVNHGIVANEKEAGELALSAGVDMDMQGAVFQNFLKASLAENRVSIGQIDEAVRRILRLKEQLGLFANPYKFCDAEREKRVVFSKENREAARDVARKSIVLLKNEGQALPFPTNLKSLAVIGPLADNKLDLIGNWSGAGDGASCISLLEGLKNRFPGLEISHEKGCEIEGGSRDGFAKALAAAAKADFIVLALGEHAMMSGEACSRADIKLPGLQTELALEILRLKKPSAVVLMNGRPLVFPEIAEAAPAIVEAWWLGTEAGNALADVLSGDHNPSGKLPMTFPRSVGQIPIFYNDKRTGRPQPPADLTFKWCSRYQDVLNSPQFPFGWGLSFTTFSISGPRVEKVIFQKNEPIRVSITVENTGRRDGAEVVQLYVRDLVGSVTRPVKELKGIRKIFLQAGARAEIEFVLTEKELGFFRRDMTFGSEPGEFDLMVGANSEELKTVRVRVAN